MVTLLVAVLYLTLHIGTYREMRRIGKGRELNRVLGLTARNMLVYGVATVVGLVFHLW